MFGRNPCYEHRLKGFKCSLFAGCRRNWKVQNACSQMHCEVASVFIFGMNYFKVTKLVLKIFKITCRCPDFMPHRFPCLILVHSATFVVCEKVSVFWYMVSTYYKSKDKVNLKYKWSVRKRNGSNILCYRIRFFSSKTS